jgi:hypothetical protein
MTPAPLGRGGGRPYRLYRSVTGRYMPDGAAPVIDASVDAHLRATMIWNDGC